MKRLHLLKSMLLLFALIVGSVNGWADYEEYYNLDCPKKSSNSAYGSNYNITVNGMDWNAPGNQNIDGGWRIGGSSITNVNRVITGKSKMGNAISKITFNHSGRSRSSVTVPSVTLTVASDASFEDIIDEVVVNNPSITSAGSFNFTPTSPLTQWAKDSYYKITIKVSNSNSSNGGLNVSSIVFYKNAYTITAVSNNESWGTVSGTTTITATPADGYRVKAGDEGYTVTSGTADVDNNGDNTFSVSASSDCTVRINFEAIPTRTITVTPTSDGTITVMNGEDEVASGSSVREGTELTISAVAGANKEFASWSVTGATPASTTDAETTFTVGETDVTIAASFNDIVTHDISWSVNGTIVKVENVKEGNALSFAAPASGSIPAGYVFKGWSESAILTPQATETGITYVSSGTSTKNVTYYAILAAQTGNIPASLTKMAKGDTFAVNDKVVVVGADEYGSYGMYQETISSSYVNYFSFTENVENIAADAKKWWTVTAGSDGKWILGDATNGYLYSSGSNNLSVDKNNSTQWTLVDNNDGTFKFDQGRYLSCRSDLTGDNTYRYRLAGSTPGGIYNLNIYKYVAATTTYSNYCTSIPNASVTITSAKYATFCDNVTRDFSESGITVYTAESDGSKVTLTEVEDGVVPDGEGVILFCKTADTYTVPATTKDATDYEGLTNEMVGVLKSTLVKYEDGTKKNFILTKNAENKVGFMKATVAGANMPANRAYLSITVAPAREFLFFDDETTGINAVENSNADVKDAVIYNLNGQRVMNPTKGLYIVNGKKVMFNK